mgnify:CR=1 FL=1
MNYPQTNPYSPPHAANIAARAEEWERAAFIRRTYSHLALAVGMFVLIELAVFTFLPQTTLQASLGLFGRWTWLLALGGFMFVSFLAERWARSDTSTSLQYLGLGLYVAAESVLFIPLLYLAQLRGTPDFNPIAMAATISGIIFGGLTLFVFITKTDFSGLGKYLMWAGLAAMGLIVCGIVFGFHLGMFFIYGMIALMSGYILYETSNVMLHYRTDQHVAAALGLFASVATLFWYVLLLVMNRD